MPDDSSLPAPTLDDARARVVERLSAHFAHDHLTMAELESRLERVYRARTPGELREVVAGLPASPVAPAVAPSGEVAPERSILAVMGGATRRGVWPVPRKLNIVAVMGGVDLDLREAILAPGTHEISIFALMGGATVRVPPHVRVEVDGTAIMGGFADQMHVPGGVDPVLTTVVVRGFVLMGGVEVKVQRPREREHEREHARDRDDDEDDS